MRGRKVSAPPEVMEELGKELVEWVKKNDPLHISQWYTIEKGFIWQEWKNFIVLPEFRPYYEKAQRMIGLNYINGRVHPSIAQRFLRLYFNDLREMEDKTSKYLSELKLKQEESEPANLHKLAQKAAEGELSQK